MTANQLSAKIEGIVDESLNSFASQAVKTQQALYKEIETLLSKLDLDSEGLIIQSQANRQILAKASIAFETAFKESGYYQSLDNFPDKIVTITEANTAYFSFIASTFSPDAQYIKSLQRQSIGQLESYLANEGLEVAVKQPIMDILSQNINSGASYSDLLKQLRGFITGDAVTQGKLQSYAGQIVTDTLFNFSRSLQESVSQNAGLQFIRYSGGTVADTRDFCAERVDNFYHKAEVEKWASLSWEGKRKGTTSSTIFIYAGGYRCMHQIVYVSEAIVPHEVIQRAKDLGYYQK